MFQLRARRSTFVSFWISSLSVGLGLFHRLISLFMVLSSLSPTVHIFFASFVALRSILFLFFCCFSFWFFFTFVLKSVFCIHCQSFIRENMDHAYYLSRICCCSCHYCWICAFCCKLIVYRMLPR